MQYAMRVHKWPARIYMHNITNDAEIAEEEEEYSKGMLHEITDSFSFLK